MTYYQPRSYGELAILQRRGLGAAEEDSAEAIFGKIVGGLTEVAKVVVPAVVPKSGTGSSTVDDLLKRLTNGTAISATSAAQPVATTATGGLSTTTIVLGLLAIGGAVILLKKKR